MAIDLFYLIKAKRNNSYSKISKTLKKLIQKGILNYDRYFKRQEQTGRHQ